MEGEKLQWFMLEYEEKERSADWFWALGVIVVTSSVAAVIFGNYFFAALLIIGGGLLGFFANRKPDLLSYELNQHGLQIGNRLYPYENMKSFWVQVGASLDSEIKPMLFIRSERVFMPVLNIPIEYPHAEDIHAFMLSKNIPEEEMKEHPTDKIMEALGF